MKRAASIQDAIQHMKGGYDVVPANIMLAGAEQELSQTGKEHRLKEAVAPLASDYDFIVIDTPPSLGVLTVNAFTCATDILIPTTAEIFATAGISPLNETVTSVQKYCNPAVKVRGILFTRFNPRANISWQMKELAEQLGEYISAPIYKTYVKSLLPEEIGSASICSVVASSNFTVYQHTNSFFSVSSDNIPRPPKPHFLQSLLPWVHPRLQAEFPGNRCSLPALLVKTLETARLRAVTIRYTPFPAKEVTFHH